MTTLDLDTINQLRAEGFQLTTGHHDPTEGEGCAMDLIAWQTTGQITDMPDCVHPILARLVHRINDDHTLPGDDRWRIVTECGPLLVGSNEWPVERALWVLSVAGRTVDGLVDALSRSAYLSGADLSGAYLSGADLAGAYLAGANLTGAVGNSLTRLPDGWRVADSGLIEGVPS